MRIDRDSLGARLLFPIYGLFFIVALIGFIAVYRITSHIQEDYHRFSAKSAAAGVSSILDMAASDLITVKLTGNPVVVEAKKKAVLEAIRNSWTRLHENGIIATSDGQVLVSTLGPEITTAIITSSNDGMFSVDREGMHVLCISNSFPLWGWNVITVTERSFSSMQRREVVFILPGILAAMLLLSVGLYLVLRRYLHRPVASVITSIEQERDIAPTGITELDKIGTAVNEAFRRERERTEELENELGERIRAEAGLQKSEKKYRELFDHAGDAIFIVDLSGRMLDANEAACVRLGYSRDELMNMTPMDIDSPEHAAQVPARIESLKRNGSLIFETSHMRKDGTAIPTEVGSRVIEFDGKPAILSTARDISERRRLEEQLRQSQKMESIGTLAGGIAHDFNNILTAIIGYGSITLMKMGKDDSNRFNIEQILAAADRAANLTKDMLLFSRKQRIENKPVDLNDIIRKMEKFLMRVIGEDIAFRTIISAETLPVLADEHQMGQVLMNLAVNARDAMQNGGVLTIASEEVLLDSQFIALHGYGAPGRYALITVSDTGEGMDEQTRQKIFEPFFTTKEVGKGTGLGLAVAYGIVQQHDGYIYVYSEPKAGTTFRIYLPLTASEIDKTDRTEAAPYPQGGTETILLAEDDEALRKMTSSLLVSLGYTIIIAVDGEDALQKFRGHQEAIDLLLFDIIMPKKSGNEAYAEIRKLRHDMKAVFMSGYSPDIIRNKVALADAATIVYKPVRPSDLLEKIRSLLDNRKDQGIPAGNA